MGNPGDGYRYIKVEEETVSSMGKKKLIAGGPKGSGAVVGSKVP